MTASKRRVATLFPAGAEVLLTKYFPAQPHRMPVWSALSSDYLHFLLPAAGSASAGQAHGTTPDLAQQELARFEKRVTVKVLPNGLTVLLIERPEAPVFSYYTLVDAGDANDPTGQSGLAHMFEHLAFKGTEEIGTTNWPAEKVALAESGRHLRRLRRRIPQACGTGSGEAEAVARGIRSGEEGRATVCRPQSVHRDCGGERRDRASMPPPASIPPSTSGACRRTGLELWAYMESGRIGHPVPREFYKERDVVMEERRMRTDSNPIGRMVEQFLATAYVAHPYGRPGWAGSRSSHRSTPRRRRLPQEVLHAFEHRDRGGRRPEGDRRRCRSWRSISVRYPPVQSLSR